MKKRLLLAVLGAVLILAGCGKNEADKYPAGTLTDKPGETVCNKASDFPSEKAFPTRNYIIAMPEELDSYGDNYLRGSISYTETDFEVIVYEADTQKDMLSSVWKLGIAGDASINYRNVIENSGYINGYPASYYAGTLTCDEGGTEQTAYAVAYNLILPDNSTGNILTVSCKKLENLGLAKVLLDEMVYSIHASDIANVAAGNEENATEYVSEPEGNQAEGTETISSTENPLDDLEFMTVEFSALDNGESTITNEVDFNGYLCTTVDHAFEVSGSFKEMFVIFTWNPATVIPSGVHLKTPTGTKYYNDEEFSMAGEYVFIVPSANEGTYTMHIETYDALYGCSVVYMDKEVYYMTYLNMDEDGNPLRGM